MKTISGLEALEYIALWCGVLAVLYVLVVVCGLCKDFLRGKGL